jgi:hypothetical protein
MMMRCAMRVLLQGRFVCAMMSTLWLTTCGVSTLNQDGGSTVGPGFVATGTSYLAGDYQGVAIVCRSGNAIFSVSSLVIKELPTQKLTLNIPEGSLSESAQSVVLRINSFDASKASSLRQTAVAQINGITYATQALSPVTPASGAVIATGCQLQRLIWGRSTVP